MTAPPAALAAPVRIVETGADLSGIDAASFDFAGRAAPLALAFVSPHLDFAATVETLRRRAGETPLIGISTAGELCSLGGGLYRDAGPAAPRVVMQAFSPELAAAVSIHAIDLAPAAPRETRLRTIAAQLESLETPFFLDFRDTLALAFVDGLSHGEDILMEAIYRVGRFPCLFVGGSSGGKLDFSAAPLFDGGRVLSGHAVVIFVKLAAGMRYGVLKSQNFRKTDLSFVAVDADADRRTVSTFLDPETDREIPAIETIADRLGVAPERLDESLAGHTFGIDVDGEIFVRSVAKIDATTGKLHFFCDINPGDELFLLKATDFVAQTRADLAAFLDGKPKPVAALLNDCILRRLNNLAALGGLDGAWDIPAAGFSTFGELLGININQTLTAVVFFAPGETEFRDAFLDSFPIHYAHYQDHFTRCRLNRVEVLNRLRAEMIRRLTASQGASRQLADGIESMLAASTSDLRGTLESIRTTIHHEIATEQRARRAEQQLTEAVEAIGEGFLLYDAEDRLVLANRRIHEIFGCGEEVFRPGRTFDEIVADLARRGRYASADLGDFLELRAASHRIADGSTMLQHLTGNRWLISRDYRTRDGGIVGIRTDITELKRREDDLERLKQRYELILGAAGDGIVGVDADGRIGFANPAAAHALATTPEALQGRIYTDALGYGGIPDVAAQAAAGTGVRECVYRRADGGEFTAEYLLTPIREDDCCAGAVLVFRDVTLRKAYEAALADQQKTLERQVAERTQKLTLEMASRIKIDQALRESQKRLLAITASLFEAVMLVDRDGIVVFANKAAQRWLEADNLLESELDEVFTLGRGNAAIRFADSPFRRVIETGETELDDDAAFILAGGRRLAVAYAASLLEESGKQRIAVVSFRSIDALKAAQREALQASRLASVGQLAAGIAHEINTPIQYVGDNLRYFQSTFADIATAIAAARDAVADPAAKAKVEETFKDLGIDDLLVDYPEAIGQSLEGVGHVTHIVRSMKDFSHPGSTAKVNTDINRAIDSTITVCRNEWKHVADLTTDLAPDLPQILCFPADINQVFLNLIVNAAHAIGGSGRKGTISVATRVVDTWLEIRIADDGPGVPPALRERIFDPFFTTKPVGKGTGQGLSICLDIVVKKHGGRLFLDETVAQGATFVVRLPLGEAA